MSACCCSRVKCLLTSRPLQIEQSCVNIFISRATPSGSTKPLRWCIWKRRVHLISDASSCLIGMQPGHMLWEWRERKGIEGGRERGRGNENERVNNDEVQDWVRSDREFASMASDHGISDCNFWGRLPWNIYSVCQTLTEDSCILGI